MAVKLTRDYRVTIPKAVRDQLGVKPGAWFDVIVYDKRIQLVLVRDIREVRGSMKGMDTTIVREADRL